MKEKYKLTYYSAHISLFYVLLAILTGDKKIAIIQSLWSLLWVTAAFIVDLKRGKYEKE